jgi:hypothetical protein
LVKKREHASMKHIYRSVLGDAVAVAVGLLAGAQAMAERTAGQISAGAGSISRNGATATINQGTPKLAIDWQGFNVGVNETSCSRTAAPLR